MSHKDVKYVIHGFESINSHIICALQNDVLLQYTTANHSNDPLMVV